MGAPYEDGQRGAVYIYLGGATGISLEYSQKILASELSPALRGFGISISHGLDVDDNKYSGVWGGDWMWERDLVWERYWDVGNGTVMGVSGHRSSVQ